MADIALRSTQLVDDWGAGYRPSGSPASPRYTVTKSVKDNGNGTGTITLTVTLKTNSGYMHGGYSATLNFTVAGVSASKTWKSETTNWNQNSSYSTSIAVTIPLDGATTKTADLWLTVAYYDTAQTAFTFRASQQGGDQITGVPVGYRASTFGSLSNFSTGAADIGVSVTRRTASFTNRLTLKIGSTTIATWSGLGDVTSVELSAANRTALNNAIPNSPSATATMVLETMNGSTVFATTSRKSTATVQSNLKPSFTSITAADTVTAVSSLMGAGVYVQNLSKPKFTINGASAPQGASIKSYKIEFNGQTWNSSTGTSSTLNWSGSSKTATATVTDSRGRTATKTLGITPIAYSPPTLTGVQTRRASSTGGTLSDEGVYLRVDRSASISALQNKNQIALKIEHRLSGNTSWIESYTNTWAAGTNSISGQTVVTAYTYSVEQSFDVRVTVSDKFNYVRAESSISSASFPLVIGPRGVGIGKVPTGTRVLDIDDGLWLGGVDVGAKLGSIKSAADPTITVYLQSSNANSLVDPWVLGSNGSNYPSSGFWYVNTVFYSSTSGNAKQIAYEYTGDRVFTRKRTSGTWSAWVEVRTGADPLQSSIITSLQSGLSTASANASALQSRAIVTGNLQTWALKQTRNSTFATQTSTTGRPSPSGFDASVGLLLIRNAEQRAIFLTGYTGQLATAFYNGSSWKWEMGSSTEPPMK